MTDIFSVAMCTYNGARYLGEQLESLAAQTRLPDELVLFDDGSVDDTVALIEKFAVSSPFAVRLEVNKVNLGSTRNFEKAIRECKGDVIALADQDDVWLPQKLETLDAEFQRSPDVGLVFSDAEVVDDNLRPLGERLWNSVGFDETRRHKLKTDRRMEVLLPGWTVTGATLAFRSKFRPLVVPIPDDLPVIHDGWIAAVVGAVADVAFIEEPLVLYRQHAQQQIGAPNLATLTQTKKVDIREAMNRANAYDQLILVGEQVRARLVEHSQTFENSEALRKLDSHLNHLRTRERLPKNKLRRVPDVSRELLARRYHRYSNGFYSAVKDLLA
jgi:glycosyltransferase involved in cell wall biosynthesis